nr:HYD1 signature containing ADP-ribosyltransferase family protein [Colwellia sp. E2M01]
MAINGVNSVNSASLGANVAGLFIPGATGLGTTVRVRHYTNKSSANKIMDSGEIVAKDNGRVYVESASKKALSPKKAEAKHKIKEGKGNSYVETDVPADNIEMVKNPLTGKKEMTIKGNVKLDKPEVKHRNN